MKTKNQSRTINYLRAIFQGVSVTTLEEALKSAHAILPTVKERSFSFGEQELKGCHVRQTEDGHFVHITLATPGEPASMVPVGEQVGEVDVQLADPPAHADYMDSDMFFLVKDNHMLFCSSGMKYTKAKDYIRFLFERTGQPETVTNFYLHRVANVDKLRLIRQGVNAVRLGCGVYAATEQYEERISIRQRLLGPIVAELRALTSKDPRLRDITENENLTAELIIKINRSKKGGELGQARMEILAEKVIEEDEDGFRIETFNGITMTQKEITLRKEASLEKYGKSVHYEDAWKAMSNYFAELRRVGALE